MFLTILLLAVFLGVYGSSMRDGLWTNTLRLVNVILSATVASSLGEPTAKFLEGYAYSWYFFLNFLGVWLIFVLVYAFLRTVTDKLSKVKVRFLGIVNTVGSHASAVIMAYTFTCFVLFTLHQAPLGKTFMGGGFNTENRMFFGLAPDRQWESYMALVSGGAYFSDEKKVFDPDKYQKGFTKFRGNLQAHVEKQKDKQSPRVRQNNPLAPKR